MTKGSRTDLWGSSPVRAASTRNLASKKPLAGTSPFAVFVPTLRAGYHKNHKQVGPVNSALNEKRVESMNEEYAPYFFIVFILLFGIMWLGITTLLRSMASMSKLIEFDPGPPNNKTGWGSGNVNGVSMRNCLRVVSHNEGFVIETQKIFGGGKLWIPKEGMVIGEVAKKTFFKPKKIDITSENNRVSLHGKLIDAII